MSTLHDLLEAAINERLAVGFAAAAAKPGTWKAITTHDGWEFDGFSRVVALEETATGRISRPVASQIADALTLQRAPFSAEPVPAAVANHIAANGPDRTIRDCVEDAEVLVQHPAPWCTRCREMQPCDEVLSLARRHNIPLSTKEGTT